ncbi:hypothetical protein TNCV_3238881 [Trichonephila clavipes]|nr:hypothetical protein TNCV_3238881 [Trichonephila clavipes]
MDNRKSLQRAKTNKGKRVRKLREIAFRTKTDMNRDPQSGGPRENFTGPQKNDKPLVMAPRKNGRFSSSFNVWYGSPVLLKSGKQSVCTAYK